MGQVEKVEEVPRVALIISCVLSFPSDCFMHRSGTISHKDAACCAIYGVTSSVDCAILRGEENLLSRVFVLGVFERLLTKGEQVW